jgi:hypothetical protein
VLGVIKTRRKRNAEFMYVKARGTYSYHDAVKRYVPTGLQALLHGRSNLLDLLDLLRAQKSSRSSGSSMGAETF